MLQVELPVLDGHTVTCINADLTSDADAASAKPLAENAGIAFMGDTKGGGFDIPPSEARFLLSQPNPNGRRNSDVVRPWVNGADITKRPRAMWIIDFGCDRPLSDAAGYEAPFSVAEKAVQPERKKNRRAAYAERWWIHVEPRPAMRRNLLAQRFIATPNVTKHRLFVFLTSTTLPDHQLIVFTRSDNYFLGVLHSAIHELWALRMGTQLEDRPRYTPTTCFETFPLPWPPGQEPVAQPPPAGLIANQSPPGAGVLRNAVAQPPSAGQAPPGAGVLQAGVLQRIADAARKLDAERERWLNPPEWIDPIAQGVDTADTFADVPEEARPLIRQSFIMAAAAKDPRLKKRTLTNLYNERPTWLRLAHEELDRAVLAAYAGVDPEGGWSEDWADVWKDSGAGQPLPDGHPLAARRAETDQKVLSNLLRMNLARTR